MHPDYSFLDVPEERLELSRDNSQRLLRPQRLPISPSGHLSSTKRSAYSGCKYNAFGQFAIYLNKICFAKLSIA